MSDFSCTLDRSILRSKTEVLQASFIESELKDKGVTVQRDGNSLYVAEEWLKDGVPFTAMVNVSSFTKYDLVQYLKCK